MQLIPYGAKCWQRKTLANYTTFANILPNQTYLLLFARSPDKQFALKFAQLYMHDHKYYR